MPVNVSPHLCLPIGQVVTRTAVQRKGVPLPLAVIHHVTPEKALPLRLKATYVTPGHVGRWAQWRNGRSFNASLQQLQKYWPGSFS